MSIDQKVWTEIVERDTRTAEVERLKLERHRANVDRDAARADADRLAEKLEEALQRISDLERRGDQCT